MTYSSNRYHLTGKSRFVFYHPNVKNAPFVFSLKSPGRLQLLGNVGVVLHHPAMVGILELQLRVGRGQHCQEAGGHRFAVFRPTNNEQALQQT